MRRGPGYTVFAGCLTQSGADGLREQSSRIRPLIWCGPRAMERVGHAADAHAARRDITKDEVLCAARHTSASGSCRSRLCSPAGAVQDTERARAAVEAAGGGVWALVNNACVCEGAASALCE